MYKELFKKIFGGLLICVPFIIMSIFVSYITNITISDAIVRVFTSLIIMLLFLLFTVLIVFIIFLGLKFLTE